METESGDEIECGDEIEWIDFYPTNLRGEFSFADCDSSKLSQDNKKAIIVTTNQHGVGNCSAHAGLGMFEGRYRLPRQRLNHYPSPRFSLQCLLDNIEEVTGRVESFSVWDVYGGFAKGIALENEYKRQMNPSHVERIKLRIASQEYYLHDREPPTWICGEKILTFDALTQEIKNNGPVLAGFNVGPEYRKWSDMEVARKKVYDENTPRQFVRDSLQFSPHMVSLIGFEGEEGNGYVVAKNSYGSHWGDHGVFRLIPEIIIHISIPTLLTEENIRNWLTDEKGRDQFVTCAGSDTEIFWNDTKPNPVHKRAYWNKSCVQWSPLGTYLATVLRGHPAILGGDRFYQLMRYNHYKVQLFDFSPMETYMVTYSSHEPRNRHSANRVIIKFFEVITGKVMKDIEGSADEFSVGGTGVAGVSWPIFRWGGSQYDKYFAKMGENKISIYETKTFSRIGMRSLIVPRVMDFSWSPTEPFLAVYVPELGGNKPESAKVSIIEIPSKKKVREHERFCVRDCKMYWQSRGDYLAVKFDLYTSTKRSSYTDFDIFHIKETNMPIQTLKLPNKNEKIMDFVWEPKGHRFSVIHGDTRKPIVSFYAMRTNQISELITLEETRADSLFWSPSGNCIVLAKLKGSKGQLVFYNVDELKIMGSAEHFMATSVQWDPTGRYVATTSASSAYNEKENGVNMWSVKGKLLYSIRKDNFHLFMWRQRPVSTVKREEGSSICMPSSRNPEQASSSAPKGRYQHMDESNSSSDVSSSLMPKGDSSSSAISGGNLRSIASNLNDMSLSAKSQNSSDVKSERVKSYQPEKWMIPDKAKDSLSQLNLAIVGHVDSGKSTLSGRLLHLLGRITQKEMRKYEKEAKIQGKGSFAYAWAMDESSEERERGITMTVGVAYFDSKNYHVVVLDSPGHKDFVPNMISGATQADAAILVIDASTGAFEAGMESGKGQTREHAHLIRSFGVEQIIIAVNKLDIVEYAKGRFDLIKMQLGTFLHSCGFKDSSVFWIPLSVMENQNLLSAPTDVRLSSWYNGPCLLDAIDSLQPPAREFSKPLRMPICDVVKSSSQGQVSVCGKLEVGALQSGLKVVVMPSREVGTVRSVERDSHPCPIARAGDSVVVSLAGIDANRMLSGGVICHPDFPVAVSRHLELRVLTLDLATPILIGSHIEFHIHHAKEAARVVKITSLLDLKTGKVTKKSPRCLTSKQSAVIEVGLDSPVCVEEYSKCKALGRVFLRTLGSTIAVGIVTRIIEDQV